MNGIDRLEQVQRLIRRLQRIERPRLLDRSNPMASLSDLEFKRRFRLRKETVNFCVGLIEHELVSPVKRGCQIPPLLQFLVALRFYACGAFQIVIGDLSNFSQGTISNIVRRVSLALAKHSARYIKWPRGDEVNAIRQSFYQIAEFPGIIGAIDCTHIEIDSPGGPNAELFRNRKGHFSLNVQAVCTADLIFTNLVCRWYGSAHDSRIFDNSNLSTQLSDGVVAGTLVGDQGYPLLPHLMTPFEKPRTGAERRYNKAQAKTRNPIERGFGVVKRRFACLKKLRLKIENVVLVTVCCFLLHNIARGFGDFDEDEEDPDEEDTEVTRSTRNDPRGETVRRQIVINHFSN